MALTLSETFATPLISTFFAGQGKPMCLGFTSDIAVVNTQQLGSIEIRFDSNPVDGDNVTIDGVTFIFRNTVYAQTDVPIGASISLTNNAFQNRLNRHGTLREKYQFLGNGLSSGVQVYELWPEGNLADIVALSSGTISVFENSASVPYEILPNYEATLRVAVDGTLVGRLRLEEIRKSAYFPRRFETVWRTDIRSLLIQALKNLPIDFTINLNPILAQEVHSVEVFPEERYFDATLGQTVKVTSQSWEFLITNGYAKDNQISYEGYYADAQVFQSTAYNWVSDLDYISNPIIPFCSNQPYYLYAHLFGPANYNIHFGGSTLPTFIGETGVYRIDASIFLNVSQSLEVWISNPVTAAEILPRVTFSKLPANDPRCCCGGQLFFRNTFGLFDFVYVSCPLLQERLAESIGNRDLIDCDFQALGIEVGKYIEKRTTFDLVEFTEDMYSEEFIQRLLVSPEFLYNDFETGLRTSFLNIGGQYELTPNRNKINLSLTLGGIYFETPLNSVTSLI